MLGSVLQQYREGHDSLIHWIEETTEMQENTKSEQSDSRALSEQLAQQTVRGCLNITQWVDTMFLLHEMTYSIVHTTHL